MKRCPSFSVARYILRCSAQNIESELVLATNRHSAEFSWKMENATNRHTAEVSWKMKNATGNLTRVEADHLE
jgi:hypothetical protein